MRRALSLLAILATCGAVFATAQDNKEKKDPPKIFLVNPLGLQPGQTKKVLLRGLRLDGATEVKLSEGAWTAKVVGSAKSAASNQQNPQRVGDTQAEVEIVVPADAPASGKLEVRLVTPAGESEPIAIQIGGEFSVVEEKEPNDGFKQAQAISLPQIVEGSIHGNQNVDVFSVEPPAGQKIVVEVLAARLGSGLDAFLTIYDAKGAVLATSDDIADSPDARIELTSPGGKVFIALQDANDQGGAAYPYRLVVRTAP